MSSAPPRSRLAIIRRVIVAVIVVAFSTAALGGIVVLLGASLGETAGRVLGTTAVVGAYSVAVLCCAALAGRRLQLFGYVGAAVCAASAALTIVMIWIVPSGAAGEALLNATWTGVAATAGLSLASLLLLLADRRRAAVRGGLYATLAMFAVVLGMTVYLIWWAEHVHSEVFARVLGIAAILAALGAVVVPVLSLLLPDAGRASRAQLPPELAAALLAEAQRRGIGVAELVAPVLNARPEPAPVRPDGNTI